MTKVKWLAIILICLSMSGCDRPRKVNDVYRCFAGKKDGFNIWIVDGYRVRHKIYQEFLYGGNEQRYPFSPKGEIWIDHAVSCEEYELNERHLMAYSGGPITGPMILRWPLMIIS
jgi:hypothetical protein